MKKPTDSPVLERGAEITLPWRLTSQHISDFFATAIEGGFTNYWCDGIEVYAARGKRGLYGEAKTFERDWMVRVSHEAHPGKQTTHEIHPIDLQRALTKCARQAIELLDPESVQFDAVAADLILQFACFDEEVFA